MAAGTIQRIGAEPMSTDRSLGEFSMSEETGLFSDAMSLGSSERSNLGSSLSISGLDVDLDLGSEAESSLSME